MTMVACTITLLQQRAGQERVQALPPQHDHPQLTQSVRLPVVPSQKFNQNSYFNSQFLSASSRAFLSLAIITKPPPKPKTQPELFTSYQTRE
jgi:hypothetical protein